MLFRAFMTRSFWTQCLPPAPTLTEKDLPPGSQVGKVFVVTGGSSGLGLELIKLLYPTGATIYMAARSRARAEKAIHAVIAAGSSSSTATAPQQKGGGNSDAASSSSPPTPPSDPDRLKFLHLDLDDLDVVRAAAATLTAQESRLDVLWNNAAITPTAGLSVRNGVEGYLAVNCVGPLLFTQGVLPLLRSTAAAARAAEPDGSGGGGVRVVWTTSIVVECVSPLGGVDLELAERLGSGDAGVSGLAFREYAASKCGNWFLAAEMARRYGEGEAGIVSVSENPGQLKTAPWKTWPTKWEDWRVAIMFVMQWAAYKPVMGAYTMLYAGFAPEVAEHNGANIMPWGRIMDVETWPRRDIVESIDKGFPEKFWEWCEEKAKIKN